MRVEAYLSAAGLEGVSLQGRVAVVVDVLRCTSSVVEALAAGATAVYPTDDTEDALRLASSIGREDTLLCGERRGLKIAGFDLGNSPSEFTPETVGGKRLVMSTTNGTRALNAAAGADRVLVASLLNLSASVEAARDAEALALVCAGRAGRFALEDALCAGTILRRVLEGRADEEHDLDDAARVLSRLHEIISLDVDALMDTEAGRALQAIDLGGDVADCARVDTHDLVAELEDSAVRVAHGS